MHILNKTSSPSSGSDGTMDQEPTFGKKMLELYFGDKRDRESRQKGRDQPLDMLPNDRTDFTDRDNYGSIEQDA